MTKVQIKKGQLVSPFGTWLDSVPLGTYLATRDFDFEFEFVDGWGGGYELAEKSRNIIQHYINMGCLVSANPINIHMFDC